VREPQLREIGVQAFRKRLTAFLDVYAAAMAPPADQLPGRHSIMHRHSTYPGFRAFVAERPRRLTRTREVVGFVYGFHGVAGQWWHDVVYDALSDLSGEQSAEQWLADPFEVAELHVHPRHQSHGLGRALLTQICAGRRERTVVLSTLDRPDTKARHLYRSVGMIDLLADFEFPGGGPPYAVMAAALPLAAYAEAPSSP
jgi:GNAT superfamily N-acetyltransferase